MQNRGAQKMKAAQITLLRPLLELTIPGRQRNCNIRNRLKIGEMVEYLKAETDGHPEDGHRNDRNISV